MIKVGILGDIGSGKSYVAKQFGYPVFDADAEVNRIYKKNKICFNRLKKKLPKYISSFPVKKKELGKAIDIEVDGGINEDTAPLVIERGATILVAGTAIFKQSNYTSAISRLRQQG